MTNLQFLAHVELPACEEEFSLQALRSYQLAQVNHTISYAAANARFYRERLGRNGKPVLSSLEQLQELPMTTAEELSQHPLEDFLCVRSDEVSRIVTLRTSGSETCPKRIAFTQKDLLATIHFFDFALQDLTGAETTILLCMPGTQENGLCDLLTKGADRFDARAVHYGRIADFADAADAVDRIRPHCIIGIPQQLFGLAKYLEWKKRKLLAPLNAVLLSSDSLAGVVRNKVEKVFGCPVFNHYGTTEMGYAAALECERHDGMHLREAELYFEVVDPDTGRWVPEGTYGELVFTTLRRNGMPLIRYRTGDRARFLPGDCPCGTILPRLEAPERIYGHCLQLAGRKFTLRQLDEQLLQVDGLVDYALAVERRADGEVLVTLRLWYLDEGFFCEEAVRRRLADVGIGWGREQIRLIDQTGSGEDYPGCRGKRLFYVEAAGGN